MNVSLDNYVLASKYVVPVVAENQSLEKVKVMHDFLLVYHIKFKN